jgi:alkanesulfonate monooxygenase SsuD/methylene tetrahydromethanopterin reductase-like flavin-dependent oxidoreductase (luciferase family)
VWAWTREAYDQRVRTLRAACERVGRDPASISLSLGLLTLVGESEADVRHRFERLRGVAPPGVLDRVPLEEWRRGRLVGTVEQVREQVAGWADAGVDELIVGAGPLPFTVVHPDDLDAIAHAVGLGAG